MKLFLIILMAFSIHVISVYAKGTIKGKVVNIDGIPVKYAIVILSDGSGTECDSLGSFIITTNFELPVLLKISAVNYLEKEMTINKNEDEIVISLENKNYEMNDVVITTRKSIKINSSVSAFEIEEKEITKTLPLHIGEVLETKAGFTIRSGYSSPLNLRGLSSKRMLVLRNGIRQFSSYTSGFMLHTINAYDLEKVEVEKGASTVKYGAGAMAGIINFIDKVPFTDSKFEGKLMSGISANNKEKNFMFTGGWNTKKFFAKLTVKQRYAENFYYANGTEALNSAYSDKDYSLITGYSISKNQTLTFNASIHDGGPWGKPKGFNGSNYMFLNCNKELYSNFSLTYTRDEINFARDLNITFFYSNENREMEKKYYTAAGNILSFKENSIYDTYALGSKATALFKIAKNLNLSSGIEMYSMHISTPVKAIDYLQVFKYENRVSKNARLYNFGLYSEADYLISKNVIVTAGIRYDLSKNFEGDVYNLDQTSERNSLTDACSITASTKYFLDNYSTFKFNISRSIRIPNPTELFIDTYTMNGIILANPNLEAENSRNLDFTYNFNNTFFDIEITSYLWLIKNLINKEEMKYLPGTYYTYNNVGKSRLWGFETTVSTNLNNLFYKNDNFFATASLTYTNGTDVTTSSSFLNKGKPLDYIPPLNLKSQISYTNQFSSYLFDIAIQNIYYSQQTRIPEKSYTTPAYFLTNLFTGIQLTALTFKPAIRLAINNLFNIEYYSYRSYLPSIGCDFRIFLTLNFSHS